MKRAFGYRIALPVLAVFLLTGAGAHGETVANLLIGLSVIVVGAKLGAEIFERAVDEVLLLRTDLHQLRSSELTAYRARVRDLAATGVATILPPAHTRAIRQARRA